MPAWTPAPRCSLAGLTRALVVTALAEARRGTPVPAAPTRQVAAALAAAARHGLAGAGADPVTGQAVDAPTLRARLLDHVRPALRDHGDTETIIRLLRRLDDRGTGADRQRAPVHQRRIHARVHHRTRPRDAVRLSAGPPRPLPAAGLRRG